MKLIAEWLKETIWQRKYVKLKNKNIWRKNKAGKDKFENFCFALEKLREKHDNKNERFWKLREEQLGSLPLYISSYFKSNCRMEERKPVAIGQKLMKHIWGDDKEID